MENYQYIYILLEKEDRNYKYIDEFLSKEDLELEMRQEGFEIGHKEYVVFKGIELDVVECEPISILEYHVKEN